MLLFVISFCFEVRAFEVSLNQNDKVVFRDAIRPFDTCDACLISYILPTIYFSFTYFNRISSNEVPLYWF